jgi:hypothetical protein
MEAPGDCSPSRKVVSKIINLSAIFKLLKIQSSDANRSAPMKKARCGKQTGLGENCANATDPARESSEVVVVTINS